MKECDEVKQKGEQQQQRGALSKSEREKGPERIKKGQANEVGKGSKKRPTQDRRFCLAACVRACLLVDFRLGLWGERSNERRLRRVSTCSGLDNNNNRRDVGRTPSSTCCWVGPPPSRYPPSTSRLPTKTTPYRVPTTVTSSIHHITDIPIHSVQTKGPRLRSRARSNESRAGACVPRAWTHRACGKPTGGGIDRSVNRLID